MPFRLLYTNAFALVVELGTWVLILSVTIQMLVTLLNSLFFFSFSLFFTAIIRLLSQVTFLLYSDFWLTHQLQHSNLTLIRLFSSVLSLSSLTWPLNYEFKLLSRNGRQTATSESSTPASSHSAAGSGVGPELRHVDV
jgi:hypothetical protein